MEDVLIKVGMSEFKNTFMIGENGFVNYVDLQLQGDSQFLSVTSDSL